MDGNRQFVPSCRCASRDELKASEELLVDGLEAKLAHEAVAHGVDTVWAMDLSSVVKLGLRGGAAVQFCRDGAAVRASRSVRMLSSFGLAPSTFGRRRIRLSSGESSSSHSSQRGTPPMSTLACSAQFSLQQYMMSWRSASPNAVRRVRRQCNALCLRESGVVVHVRRKHLLFWLWLSAKSDFIWGVRRFEPVFETVKFTSHGAVERLRAGMNCMRRVIKVADRMSDIN